MRKLGVGKAAVFGLVAVLLAACSGGGSISDQGSGGSSSGGTSVTAAKLTLLASAPQLSSSASEVGDGVTLTAILKDVNNNVVPGVSVLFSTPDSAEINVSNPAVSDGNGRVTAILTTGGDPRNRTVTVTASAAGPSGSPIAVSVPVQIVGTTLSISGADSTQLNVDTPYTVLLADSEGAAIVGAAVTVSTDAENTVTPASAQTNSAGQAVFQLQARKAATTLNVTSLGLTTSKTIAVSTDSFSITAPAANAEIRIDVPQEISTRWFQGGNPVPDGTRINFSATRGVVTPASQVTSGGVARVSIQSSQAGFTTLVASSDALSKPSATLPMEFIAVTPSQIAVQASPAVIATNQSSEISAVVRDVNENLVKNAVIEFALSDSSSGNISSATAVTNSQGLAKVTYTASSQSGATRGVVIGGKVRGTGIQGSANVTVGGRAVGITIGTGAEIGDKDESTYQLAFTVLITDSSGNPVPDAKFTLSVRSLLFYKGTRAERVPADGCPNEDVDLNAILEGSEDTNLNGQIDPGPVSSVPTTVDIDVDGAGQFLLTYPKDFGNFVKVRIIGVATVAGTDTTESRDIELPIAEADAPFLPFNSPYGESAACDVFDPK